MRTFHVARTSRPATFTTDAARASVCTDVRSWSTQDYVPLPLALILDTIDAVTKMGACRTTPGNEKTVQMDRRMIRYTRRPNVFQLAFWALGT